MANRASASDVKKIADLSDLSDSEIDTFISDANAIVNARVKGYVDSNLLQPIEEWLAAHLAVMNPNEKPAKWEGVGLSEMRYEGEYGLGLNHTRYGQQVLWMAPKGIMAPTGGHYSHHTHTTEDIDAPSDYEPASWGGENNPYI